MATFRAVFLVLVLFKCVLCDNDYLNDEANPQIENITQYLLNPSLITKVFKSNVSEDGKLNFTELAQKQGLDCEEVQVSTEDGYILTMFHIKGNESKPIFLLHGIIDTSDTFIMRGETSLAITLAKAGYDVWAGNSRGNRYSLAHDYLDPVEDKKAFWNWSFHEIAVYDLPAMLDHVLNSTNNEKLHVIGHSQGTTSFFTLMSSKPEYNEKVNLFIALAPVVFVKGLLQSMFTSSISWPLFNVIYQATGDEGFFLQDRREIIEAVCTQSFGYDLCVKGIYYKLTGSDPEETNAEFFNTVIGHYPSSSSRKSVTHMNQMTLSGKFQQFDYGFTENLKRYDSISPPEYDLNNVVLPVALLFGKNDNLSTVKDVELLKTKLSNLVYYHEMEREQCNHVDFVWGEHMPEYLFPIIFDLLEKY